MGVRAYNRGTKLVGRQISLLTMGVANQLDAKAALWERVLLDGGIMTFHCADGAVLTAGPNRTATGTGPAFSCYRESGSPQWRGSWFGGARAVALRIVQHAGRLSPVAVVCSGTPTNQGVHGPLY